MATKDLLFSHHARMAVWRGVSTLSRAVKVTLGPGGQHAMIQQPSGAPIITKDGVTVANCVDLENPYENVGAQLVKDAARKTNELAGDGTTTAIVLAEAIIREGIRHITAGASPPAVKRGIDRATELVVADLGDRSRPCDTPQAIMQVATVAADSDPVIGALIADAIRQVGREGAIAIEDSGQLASWLDIREGLQFEGGVLSPAFFTDPERRELTLDRPRILLCGSDISRLDELLPLLEQSRESGSPLVIVVGGMTSHVLSALLLNVRQGVLQLAVVRAPSVGDHRRDLLEDVATLTGGIIVADVAGQSLSRLSLNQLGRASRAVIREDRTTIFGGAGDSTEVAARQAVARVLLTGTASQEERKTLQKRLANLTHRMAVIYVGAATETERRANKVRAENALAATRAAVEEGVLPGGGVALVRSGVVLSGTQLPGDEQVGAEIMRRALEAPLRQIAENAGYPGSVVLSAVQQRSDAVGFDAARGRYGDLFEAGILDPTRVTCRALVHAASVAGLILTADVIVTEAQHEDTTTDDPALVAADRA